MSVSSAFGAGYTRSRPRRSRVHALVLRTRGVHALALPRSLGTQQGTRFWTGSAAVYPVSAKRERVYPVSAKRERVYPVSAKRERVYPASANRERVYPVRAKRERVYPVSAKRERVYPASAAA